MLNSIDEILLLKKKLYKQDELEKEELERYKELISKILPTEISSNIENKKSMKIKGSYGQGRLSEVPWVAILDTDITNSTQRGYS